MDNSVLNILYMTSLIKGWARGLTKFDSSQDSSGIDPWMSYLIDLG
jgi:hypothetical protein